MGGRPAFETLNPDLDSELIDATGGRLTHALAVPVQVLGADDGRVLVAGFSTPPTDLRQAFWIADTYARLVSLMEHTDALDGLWQRPRHDGLTGCLTYESTIDELAREINRSARAGLPLSCCFIDLDGFKRVNDLHGHLIGNDVLADIGLALRQAVRSCDTVGRYGGDEFIAILPQTNQTEAALLAERLQSVIVLRHAARLDGQVTASIGVAEWTPGITGEELLAWADSALFAAKTLPGGIATHSPPWAADRSAPGRGS